jgi:hypothetical protein
MNWRSLVPERTHDQPREEDRMEPSSSFKIQLESALLCLDLACNAVFDGSLSRHCPACAGEDTYPLSVWLDRVEGFTQRHRMSEKGAREQEPVVVPMSIRAA